MTQSNRHTTQHSTYEPPRDVLRLSKSPITQSNRVGGKEPSDGCLDPEEPMIIQSGVETFMQSMSAEESQNDATKKDNQRKNSRSIFRPYVASSNESPMREQSEPTNTQQGHTVLNNQNGSSTTSNQTLSDKSNQNNNKQQERVSRSLIRGVRRPHSVSVTRVHVNKNRPTSQSKQENPPAKNSQQPINGTNQNSGRKNMVEARSEYKTLLRKCRYDYDKNNTNKLVDAKFKNAKEYWNMLKELSYIKPANIPLSSFEQYFKAVNNPLNPFFTPDEDVVHFNEQYVNNEFDIIFDELNLDFTHEDVLNAIKQLKLNKSGGPDKLINEVLINGKHILTNTLCELFNKIFEIVYFPDEWSEGYVIPLHKRGSLNDVGNYRGITLLSILGKLFTRVLNNRLKDWAEHYHVLIEAQAGFRPGMSTTDNVFVLHGAILHLINQGKKLNCAFVEFTKAFDYVVCENLWYKMIKYGIRGKVLNIKVYVL